MYAKIKLRQIGENCVRKWKRKVLSLLLFLWLWSYQYYAYGDITRTIRKCAFS